MNLRNGVGMWARRALPIFVLLMVGVFIAGAQEARSVTYDDINAVAKRMFCPECENIPLDKCYSTVCVQWKQEIGDQLAAGVSDDDIIAGFVSRFGDQVVGVPQDPFLRNLALIAPTLFLILAVGVGGYAIWSRLPGRDAVSDTGDMAKMPLGSSSGAPYKPAQIQDDDNSEHPVPTPRGASGAPVPTPASDAKSAAADAKYLAQLEQDLDRD